MKRAFASANESTLYACTHFSRVLMSGSFSPGPASLAHGFCFLIAPVAEPPPIRRRFELCGCTSGLSAVGVTCAAVGVLANAGEAQTAVVRCCAGEERNWLSCCSCAMSRSHCSLDIKAAVDEETATVDGSAAETCDTDGGIAKCDRCHTAARCGEHGRARASASRVVTSASIVAVVG